MSRVSIDLEWNNAYVRSAGKMLNVIISVGAIKISDDGKPLDSFSEYVRPLGRMKLRKDVATLTGITEQTLSQGITFAQAVDRLCDFIGADDVCLFWGQSDMAVLIDNCRAFLGIETVPFVRRFIDVMAYCDSKTDIAKHRQPSLSDFCAKLGVENECFTAHDAFDDAIMAYRCFEKLGGNTDGDRFVTECDATYYARRNFKKRKITDINDPALTENLFVCACPVCSSEMRRTDPFRSNVCNFYSRYRCDNCRSDYYVGFVFTETYDGVKRHRTVRKWQEKKAVTEE